MCSDQTMFWTCWSKFHFYSVSLVCKISFAVLLGFVLVLFVCFDHYLFLDLDYELTSACVLNSDMELDGNEDGCA